MPVHAMPTPMPDPSEVLLQDRHHGARLLLVEDDPANAEVVADLLRLAGLQVDLAVDGLQALQGLAARPYALVLMDVRLPGMDGILTTQALRALPGGDQVPVVALTALAFEAVRSDCLAAGMDDFLAKPVVPSQLFATVLRWLQDGRRS